MFKLAAAGMTALFFAASPLAYAENHSAKPQERLNAGEPSRLTDLRIEILKSALQLTPDQEQFWPAIEQAIRARAQHRLARLQDFAGRVSERRDSSPAEMALNINPVDFMHRRADALSQRASDLRTLGDAWQPLYATLNPDQKRRLALVSVLALRGVMNRIGGQQDQSQDSYDDDQE